MTSNLIWLLYFADAASGVQTFLILATLLGVAYLCACRMAAAINETDAPQHKVALVVLCCVAFLSALIPSRQTIYASAAIYAGAEVAGSEEVQLVRQILKRELRKMANVPEGK